MGHTQWKKITQAGWNRTIVRWDAEELYTGHKQEQQLNQKQLFPQGSGIKLVNRSLHGSFLCPARHLLLLQGTFKVVCEDKRFAARQRF